MSTPFSSLFRRFCQALRRQSPSCFPKLLSDVPQCFRLHVRGLHRSCARASLGSSRCSRALQISCTRALIGALAKRRFNRPGPPCFALSPLRRLGNKPRSPPGCQFATCGLCGGAPSRLCKLKHSPCSSLRTPLPLWLRLACAVRRALSGRPGCANMDDDCIHAVRMKKEEAHYAEWLCRLFFFHSHPTASLVHSLPDGTAHCKHGGAGAVGPRRGGNMCFVTLQPRHTHSLKHFPFSAASSSCRVSAVTRQPHAAICQPGHAASR